jgi:hypothetical protein
MEKKKSIEVSKENGRKGLLNREIIFKEKPKI